MAFSTSHTGRAAVLAFVAAWATLGYEQTRSAEYPSRPVRLVTPVAPGGGLDLITRTAAQSLASTLGQSVIVDNRPGGGTVIAMDIVAKAVPDGHTLFSGTDTFMIVGAMKRVAYDVTKAFDPVVRMTSQPAVVVVPPSLPVNSIKELVAYAKAKPGALVFGSAGIGTNGHLGLLRFNGLAHVHILHVPYKGSAPAMLDIISGQIHMVFASTIAATPYIRNARLKALAVTGSKRVASMPELPTVDEAGVPGFRMTNSFNILAPSGTPVAILRRVNEAVGTAIRSPDMRKRLAADGSEPADAHTPDQFKAEIAREFLEVAREVGRMDIKAN